MPHQFNGGWKKMDTGLSSTTRVSLHDFFTDTRQHLLSIIEAQSVVKDFYKSFIEQDVAPEQCSEIATTIRAMSQPLRDLSALLNETSHLPISVIPLRYHLLSELSYFEEQVRIVSLLLIAFRSLCSSISKQEMLRRQEILCKLETLLHEGDEITQQANIMFDQARFLERI